MQKSCLSTMTVVVIGTVLLTDIMQEPGRLECILPQQQHSSFHDHVPEREVPTRNSIFESLSVTVATTTTNHPDGWFG